MNRDKIKCIGAMIIFGTIGLLRRHIPYSSALVALIRGIVGTAFLFLLPGTKKTPKRAPGSRTPGLLALSGAALGINWILLFEAYRYTTVSIATVCYYMAPVFVLILSPVLFGETLSLKKIFSMVLALVGMVLVTEVWEGDIKGQKGILLGLGAAGMYGAVMILNKKIEGFSPRERTLGQLAFSALTLLPYVLLTENFGELTLAPIPLFLLLTAGILHTGIAYGLYFDSIKNLPAQTVAILSYLDPVTAILLSATVLGETLTPRKGPGNPFGHRRSPFWRAFP